MLILCILDGWGIGRPHKNNAIYQANTPNIDFLTKNSLISELSASGPSVGLPEGQCGNSEVGHFTIGTGKTLLQGLPLIDAIFEDRKIDDPFFDESHDHFWKEINKAKEEIKKRYGALHVVGLLSDGGVHGHIDHVLAISKIFAQEGIKVKMHGILDGRDTPPQSYPQYLDIIKDLCSKNSNIELVSLSGRFFAMDRDKNHDRTHKSATAILEGKAPEVEDLYNISTDKEEYFEPIINKEYKGILPGDGIIFTNFRKDRATQIADAITQELDLFSYAGTFVRSNNNLRLMLKPTKVGSTLGSWLSKHDKEQLRVAETEKYAHVTFFLNGGKEKAFHKEQRIIVKSKGVASYKDHPQMSASKVTQAIIEATLRKSYDLIVVNYANADMVGHTGDLEATIQAVEAIDEEIGKLVKYLGEACLIITADHGNAEQMSGNIDGKEILYTMHTCNKVPFLIYNPFEEFRDRKINSSGGLIDIAPTIFEMLDLPKPKDMKGSSLWLS